VTNTNVQSGGTLELVHGGFAPGLVLQSGATLELGPGNTVSGFTVSGVLTVTSGGSANVVAVIDFVGHYVTSNFHITSGASGTVAIFDPPLAVQQPAANFISANLALFANYLAASFPTVGHHGSGLIADVSQAGSELVLTHPAR
jgi:autotransporter passenger strand-loop-strand repeat protein